MIGGSHKSPVITPFSWVKPSLQYYVKLNVYVNMWAIFFDTTFMLE